MVFLCFACHRHLWQKWHVDRRGEAMRQVGHAMTWARFVLWKYQTCSETGAKMSLWRKQWVEGKAHRYLHNIICWYILSYDVIRDNKTITTICCNVVYVQWRWFYHKTWSYIMNIIILYICRYWHGICTLLRLRCILCKWCAGSPSSRTGRAKSEAQRFDSAGLDTLTSRSLWAWHVIVPDTLTRHYRHLCPLVLSGPVFWYSMLSIVFSNLSNHIVWAS